MSGNADAVEVVGLAAAEDGGEYLVLLGRGEDEDGMCGRFLQSLQEGVEGGRRQHVDLVYDVHGIPAGLGRNLHLVHEVLDVVDPVVGGGVKLVYAVGAALFERDAGLAFSAGFEVGAWVGAVDGLGEDSRRAGLADSPRSAEQVRVGQLPAQYGVFERLRYIVLTYKRFKGLRTILAG